MLKKYLFAFLFLFNISSLSAQVLNSLSLNDKLYGLSKFWSDVNYNFVYMYKIDPVQWNNAYREAIGNVQESKNDFEYYRELQKLCALLKDGHTQVYFPDTIQNQIMTSMFGEYRLFLTNVLEKTIVIDVNKSKEKEIPVGSEVIKVNGLSTKDYQDKYVSPYISSSTEHNLKNKASTNLLSGFNGQQYSIEIKTPKGEIRQFKLTHAISPEKELSSIPLNKRELFELKWLKDDVAYIAIRTFTTSTVVTDFEASIPQLKNAKKIIIDIRNNDGGSGRNAINIAKYFVKTDTIFGSRNFSREIIPTERAIGSFLSATDTINGKSEWGLSKDETTKMYKAFLGTKFHSYEYSPTILHTTEKISVPTVILTNNYTASAAEDFLIFLNNEENISRIGEYTNGSTGQPFQIELPGHGSAWICTKKVTFPNGEEFIGIGIVPKLIVKRNLNDVLFPNKYDSQLDAAIQFLKKNNF